MPEETPQLPVSEQEVQIEAPSLLDKIKAQKKKIFIGLGSILGILILVGAAFGVYKLGQRQIQPPPTSGPTPTLITTPTPDPTADWKIFVNTKFGYQFKYPSAWELNRGPGELNDEELGKMRGIDVYDPNSTIEGPGTGFAIDTNELHQKGDSRECSGLQDCIDKTTPFFPKEVVIEEEVFMGSKAIRITFDRETESYSQTFSYLFTLLNDDFYKFTMSSEKEDYESVRSTFDLIFSTFSFLDEGTEGERVYCGEPRPELCTMECIVNPPYICGSDGKSYCTECQACADPGVEWYLFQDQPCVPEEEDCVKTDTGESMTLAEAKEIALKGECVKEGSLKETHFCNDFTGTWWLDLEIDRPGCAPACVVNVVTKEAEINWRCTGLMTP